MALKLNSANGSVTLTPEDGSGNADVTVPRGGIGTVSNLSDLSVTATATELNILDGATLTTAELNYVDGVTSNIQTQLDAKGTVSSLSDLSITATALELNTLDGITATVAELNYVDGVTSNIQTQLDQKAETLADLSVTSTAAELNILDGATLTTTELNYVDGVTSAIQTQIDTKAPTASPTFTGSITGANLTLSGNLTVNGTTTTVNSTNTVVSDGLLELGNGTTGTPANDTGIVIERGDNDNAFIGFDESADKFIVGTGSFTGASTGNLTVSTGTLVANVEGNVTSNVTGNADTATALATGRTISLTGDVTGTSASFDGSGNVSISATIADDSHNHVISNIDGLQTALDAKAPTASPTFTGDATFDTSTLVVDSTNNRVGIGTTSPSATLEISDATSNAATLRVARSTTATNYLELGTSGGTSTFTAQGISGVDGSFAFLTKPSDGSATEAMRIDNGQNLFVGKTTFGNNTAGHQIEKTGLLRSTRDQNESAIFNRTTNDGDILTVKKDDVTVGNLKSDSGKLVVNSAGSNLVFAVGGNVEANIDAAQFYPQVNGGLDLGHVNAAWGRLRLSKGVVENTTTVTYASSIALSYTNGSIQSVTLTGNVTFTDSLNDGEAIVLMLDGGSSYTVTWTAVTKWVTGSGNAAPTLTANDTIVLWKIGSSVYAAYTGSYT